MIKTSHLRKAGLEGWRQCSGCQATVIVGRVDGYRYERGECASERAVIMKPMHHNCL
ncbi:hypothetical protein BDW68DRAFT_41351 [Aspergillus falconensis]